MIRIEILIEKALLTRSLASTLLCLLVGVFGMLVFMCYLSIGPSMWTWLYLSASKQLLLLSVFSCVHKYAICVSVF